MTTVQHEDKCVQTDPNIRLSRSMDESYQDVDLLNVRKQILDRFDWVTIELEQAIENIQRHELSVVDAQQRIDRPHIKEVIEASLNVDWTSISYLKQTVPYVNEVQMHRRHLKETKEDLYLLDLFIHRGISKIDQFEKSTNLYT